MSDAASGGSGGGTLGPELTRIYAAYQDGAMTQSLKRPCVVRMPESATAGMRGMGFLAAEEAFALKAYLRHVAYGEVAPAGATGAAGMAEKAGSGGSSGGGEPQSSPQGGATASAGTLAGNRWQPRQRALAAGAPRAKATAAPRGTVGSSAGTASGELVFRALPYLALALFFGGMALRYAAARRRPSRAEPRGELAEARPEEPYDPSRQIALDARAAWRDFGGGKAWRVGVAGTFALHLVALLLPHAVLAWGRAPWRLYLLEGSGALFGALALAGWVPLLVRCLHRGAGSWRERLRELADCLFLALCCSALLSGLLLAAMHRWGSQWGAVTLTPYLQSLARGAPVSGLIEQLPLLVRLHVVSWFALLALAPACSAAALAIHAIDRLDAAVTTPLDALRRGLWARARSTHSGLARWLWPEED